MRRGMQHAKEVSHARGCRMLRRRGVLRGCSMLGAAGLAGRTEGQAVAPAVVEVLDLDPDAAALSHLVRVGVGVRVRVVVRVGFVIVVRVRVGARVRAQRTRTWEASKCLSSALPPLPSATFFCAQSSRPSLAVRSPSLISATEKRRMRHLVGRGGVVEGGGWRVEGGGWRVEGGGWRVEVGGWRVEWRVEG